MGEVKRTITDFGVYCISLVRNPANKKPIILKSADVDLENPGIEKFFTIRKADDEKQIVYGLVCVPDEVDTQGDVLTASAIEKAMENFMKWGCAPNVDREHDFNMRDAFVRESWLVKDGDPMFTEVGGWAVGIKIKNQELWDTIKSGQVQGLSLAGDIYNYIDGPVTTGKNEEGLLSKVKQLLGLPTEKAGRTISSANRTKLEKAMEALNSAVSAIDELLKLDAEKSAKEEPQMTKEEMQALVKSTVEEAVKPLTERLDAIEKSAKPADDPEKNKPDVTAIIKSAVEEAVKPLAERVEKMEKSIVPPKTITDGQETTKKSAGVFGGLDLF